MSYECWIYTAISVRAVTDSGNYIDSDINSDVERGWRMRATQEQELACGYFFNGKPGYIAPRYMSIFINAFRPRASMEERYADGKLGKYGKAIWTLLYESNKPLGWHEIRNKLGFKSVENNKVEIRKVEAALKDLQMTFHVCICGGIDLTHSQTGKVYTTVLGYGTVDNWIPAAWMEANPPMEQKEALEVIYCQAERISKIGNAKKAFRGSLKGLS